MRIDRRPAIALVAGALLASAPLACREVPGERSTALRRATSEPPLIDGVVERLDADRVLVTDSARLDLCARGWGRLVGRTDIEDHQGRRLAADDLHVGDRVAVWPDGPVAESCPVQFTARRVRVRR